MVGSLKNTFHCCSHASWVGGRYDPSAPNKMGHKDGYRFINSTACQSALKCCLQRQHTINVVHGFRIWLLSADVALTSSSSLNSNTMNVAICGGSTRNGDMSDMVQYFLQYGPRISRPPWHLQLIWSALPSSEAPSLAIGRHGHARTPSLYCHMHPKQHNTLTTNHYRNPATVRTSRMPSE